LHGKNNWAFSPNHFYLTFLTFLLVPACTKQNSENSVPTCSLVLQFKYRQSWRKLYWQKFLDNFVNTWKFVPWVVCNCEIVCDFEIVVPQMTASKYLVWDQLFLTRHVIGFTLNVVLVITVNKLQYCIVFLFILKFIC